MQYLTTLDLILAIGSSVTLLSLGVVAVALAILQPRRYRR